MEILLKVRELRFLVELFFLKVEKLSCLMIDISLITWDLWSASGEVCLMIFLHETVLVELVRKLFNQKVVIINYIP